jgi:DNA-binding transcriptional LysR family regulator
MGCARSGSEDAFMRVDWLNAFRAMMQAGTVTGAAAVMLRTQPQVSRMISSLERELDLRLFQRAGRRLIPTPEALEFHQLIEPILNSIDGMRDAAQAIKDKRGKRVVISAEPFHLHSLVPAAVEEMARDANFTCAVDICIRALGLWMARDNVDLAVVGLPFTQTDLHQVVFAEVDLVAVLPKGHRLTSRRAIKMQDFADERFIALRPTTLLRAQIDMAVARAGLALNPHIETTSGATACELAARGLGVTVADPVLAASFRGKGVEVRPLAAGPRLTYGFLIPGTVGAGHPVRRLMGTIARAAFRLGGRYVILEPQWKNAMEDRP